MHLATEDTTRAPSAFLQREREREHTPSKAISAFEFRVKKNRYDPKIVFYLNTNGCGINFTQFIQVSLGLFEMHSGCSLRPFRFLNVVIYWRGRNTICLKAFHDGKALLYHNTIHFEPRGPCSLTRSPALFMHWHF